MRYMIVSLIVLAALVLVFGFGLGSGPLCLVSAIIAVLAFYLAARQNRLDRQSHDKAVLEALQKQKNRTD